MPFQATPKMWNPFRECKCIIIFLSFNKYSVILDGNSTAVFHIGVGNCTTVYENCNKALDPETEYAFKIRGFTSHGYRDSPTVYFVTGTSVSA